METTRKIIEIDDEKCTGCGQCIIDCAEGALKIIDGKARLVKDSYCDGLGACLGSCPEDALKIIERSAEAFDEEEVHKYLESQKSSEKISAPEPCACPGSLLQVLTPGGEPAPGNSNSETISPSSELQQWPVQLRLLPPDGKIFEDKDLLILADCVAVAYPDLHQKLIRGNTVAMTCPKLDDGRETVERLSRIFANPLRSISVAVMEVPCCSGLLRMIQQALEKAGKTLPVGMTKISARGEVLEHRDLEPPRL